MSFTSDPNKIAPLAGSFPCFEDAGESDLALPLPLSDDLTQIFHELQSKQSKGEFTYTIGKGFVSTILFASQYGGHGAEFIIRGRIDLAG